MSVNEGIGLSEEQPNPNENHSFGENVLNASLIVRSSQVSDNEQIQEQVKEESKHIAETWEQQNKTYKLKYVLNIWSTSHKEELNMKRIVAIVIFSLLIFEMILVGIAFFFMGFKLIEIETWVAETFIAGIIIQIFAIATIVVKGLFPQKSTNSLEDLNSMVDKL